MRLVELSVEEARAAIAELKVFAPFDGVVEDVNVQQGDRISAGSDAFTLSTSNRMLIALTVTEEDLLELEIGQTGLASFDAIDGIEYPVRVVAISRAPNAEQGVVTYDVEARILAGSDLAEVVGDNARRGDGAGGGFGVARPAVHWPDSNYQMGLRSSRCSRRWPAGIRCPRAWSFLRSWRL